MVRVRPTTLGHFTKGNLQLRPNAWWSWSDTHPDRRAFVFRDYPGGWSDSNEQRNAVLVRSAPPQCGKPDDFVLPRPFDGQITQARDPQAVGQMPIDSGFDEIGRKESERYRHVDFAHAALGAGGDALGRGRRILDQLLEPTAPLHNRSNQCRFRL